MNAEIVCGKPLAFCKCNLSIHSEDVPHESSCGGSRIGSEEDLLNLEIISFPYSWRL